MNSSEHPSTPQTPRTNRLVNGAGAPETGKHYAVDPESVTAQEFPAEPVVPDTASAAESAGPAQRESGHTPHSHGTPSGILHRIAEAARKPLPGAQPRLRFGMPPQSGDSSDSPVPDEGPVAVAVQNPVYMGFMLTVGVGLALLLFWVGSQTTQLLLWILAALFIALGLDPVVRWFERRRLPRPLGIAAVLIVLLGVVAAFFATLIPTVITQVNQIITLTPTWVNDFLHSDFYVQMNDRFGLQNTVTNEVQKFVKDAGAVGGLFGGIVQVGSTVANGLFGSLVVLVLTLYFLAALPAMKAWAYRLAPASKRPRVEKLSEEITRGVGNYVIGQVCVALINATVAFIVMTILGVPFNVLLAFVVALLAFVPLVGGVIAGVLVTLVALTMGWQIALIYAIVYFAYLQFEAYFVSPRIMQKAVAVPGSVAVISVIAGGTLLQVLGALIAIPTAAAIMLIIKEVLIAKQDKR